MATARNRKKAKKNRIARAKIKLVRKIRRIEAELNPNGELLVPADTESGPAMINYWYNVALHLKDGELKCVVEGGGLPPRVELFAVMKEAVERLLMERSLLENKTS